MIFALEGRRQLSLRARNTLWFVGLLAIALLSFSVATHVGIRAFLLGSLQRSLSRVVETVIHDDLASLSAKGDASVLTDLHETYATTRNDRFIRVSADSKTIYQTEDMQESNVPVSRIPRPPLLAPPSLMHYMVDGEDIVVYSASYQSADGRLFRVEAGATLYRMQQTLHFLTKLLSLITIVILLLAASGGYLLMGRPLQPLAVLSEKAAKIGRSRLGERLPVVHTGDELEQLTHSLNGMIDRLEAALDHNRRFSADASHELRTPLMVMHSDIEEILQNEDQPSQTIDNLVSTLEEIKRMTRIVNSLMAITRLDAGGEQMRKEVFDLAALARTATDQMRIVAEEKGLTVSCGCKDSVYIHADHMHIKQVLINLIDNAIKYTPARETLEGERFSDEPPVEFEVVKPETENPSVTVSVFASESHAQLKIADHGIGIPAEGLPFVFDRFYRTDFARSRGAGGVGLGLAIVKAIVTAHEGTVAITSVLSVGSVVTVTLPLATRPLLAADSQSIEEMNRSRRQLTAR